MFGFRGILAAVGFAMVVLSGCGSSSNQSGANGGSGTTSKTTLVMYSPHGALHVDPCLDRFHKEHPHIQVKFLPLPSNTILERIRAEKNNPRADIWWGAPHTMFMEAAAEGLLQPYQPTWSNHSPEGNHADDHTWYGTYLTPEVILYNHQVLKKEDVPKDWDELLDPKWKNKIVIRWPPDSGTMRTIYGAMVWRHYVKDNKPDKGFAWLKQLDANTAAYAKGPELMYRYVDAGETPLTLWNMADVYIQRTQKNHPFSMVLPVSGTPVLVEGLAIINGAPNNEAAKTFYEFITSKEELLFQANHLHRIPARMDLPQDKLPAWMTEQEIKPMKIDWKTFGPLSKEWMEHWKRNIVTSK